MANPLSENNITEKTATLSDDDTLIVFDSEDLSGGLKKLKKTKISNLVSNQANVISRIYAYSNLV